MAPVIRAANLGVRFNRNRRQKFSVRESLFRGEPSVPRGQFWALRDITFEVGPREAVGVVGANGHGKSTLLNLIAGVLLPDEGTVEVTEGVAPLIELTGGFEGELTARENIYLIGGLHGLSREQIDDRFDDIIEFSGIGDFVDTPFRHFSSGMKVRLGFSVVTTLDEPILLVDEVLAVGDRAFRRKCFARLEEMLARDRTLFLVSHSEAALSRFCTRGLYIRHGRLITDGPIEQCLKEYNDYVDQNEAGVQRSRRKRRLPPDAESAD